MTQLTRSAHELLTSQHGVASAHQLSSRGVSRHQIDALVRHGTLVPVLKGVYRHAAVRFDEFGRCAAVCIGRPDVVIGGPTAGRLWGFRRVPQDRSVHVVAPPHSQPTIARWVAPYRTAAIHDEDRVDRGDGIVLTSRSRTALDLARFVGPDDDLLSIIEQAIVDGESSVEDLRRVAADWLTPRRPFVGRFLRVLDRRLEGGGAESHLESVVGDALVRAGVRGLVRQCPIDLPGYGPARFDLAVPTLRWAIEIDGFPTHRETAGRRRDERRDRCAAQVGWSVTRLTPDDLAPRRRELTIRWLAAEHRRRATGFRSVS